MSAERADVGVASLAPPTRAESTSERDELALTGAAGSLGGTKPKDELALTGAAGSPDGRENRSPNPHVEESMPVPGVEATG